MDLGNGVEEIEYMAFSYCTSLHEISTPNAVMAIEMKAYYDNDCMQSTFVTLGEGVEEIGEYAFEVCASPTHNDNPPAVKAIKEGAYYFCTGLTTANLNDGREEIGMCALSTY